MKFDENKKYWASAFLTGDSLFVQTYSGLGIIRLDIIYPPHILSPLDEDSVVGSAALKALNDSRTLTLDESNVFFDQEVIEKDYNSWVAGLMDIYGYKSRKIFFKDMKKCTINLLNKKILIEPSCHDKLEAWSGERLSESDNVVIPANSRPAEIGAALRLAFSRCKG